MKVAQVVSTYPPYRGGMGNVAYEYTQRLRDRGINVHVYTPRYGKVYDDPDYVHRIPSPFTIGNAGVMPSLFYRLKGFDVIHLHYPFFGGAEPLIIRKAIQKDQKLVLTYHMDALAGGIRGAIFEAHRRLIFPWIVSRADKILVSSKDYAESSALKNIDGLLERVEEHPFGIDLNRFYPCEEQNKIPVLLFVGGLDKAHYFKGLNVLINALSCLKDYRWRAVVIGDGELRPQYQKQVQELGMYERFHFPGNVSAEDLPDYYRKSDIHVFPSTERAEAFGLVALEAAASGIPTIASDLPGVRTVVLDGETGLRVKPGDSEDLKKAILLLLEQTDLRQRFGLSSRKRAENQYVWDPLISKLIAVYEDRCCN